MEAELVRLRRALETMPPGPRAVFERCRFEGRDYVEIAAGLEIEVAEVERRMAAAMEYLRQAMGGEGD